MLSAAFIMQAAADGLPPTRAASVEEMLQSRHEQQLREQLARQGRWDEIREMDEARVRRLQLQKNQALTRLNQDLAREGVVDLPAGDGGGGLCPPAVRLPTNVSVKKLAPEPTAATRSTPQVR